MRMRVATNRAGILLAIMRPGQLKRTNIEEYQMKKKVKVRGSLVLHWETSDEKKNIRWGIINMW